MLTCTLIPFIRTKLAAEILLGDKNGGRSLRAVILEGQRVSGCGERWQVESSKACVMGRRCGNSNCISEFSH